VCKAIPYGILAKLDGKSWGEILASQDSKHIYVPDAVPVTC
jgi:hypothetical protein